MVYTYYRYAQKFHIEPQSWKDLFEYIHYTRVETEIESYLRKVAEGGK